MLIRMKWLALVWLFLGSTPSIGQQAVPLNAVAPVPLSFEQRLFNELNVATNNSNFCFSPYGIHQVLSKLAVIASPEAKTEIERALGGKALSALPQPSPSSKTISYRLDLLTQENEGYGIKISQLGNELLTRGLGNGDLVFKINGQVVRALKDYQQILQQTLGRDVELSGYHVKTGEPFVGLRVPLISQVKSTETVETASKTAIICDLALANSAAAMFNAQPTSTNTAQASLTNTAPANADLRIFPMQKLDLQELLTFLGTGSEAIKLQRDRQDCLAVVNLVRFDGKWQYPFDSEVIDTYHGLSADQRIAFMERVAALDYMRHADFEQVTLPIRDTSMRMRICLPLPNRLEAARSSFASRTIAWQAHEPQALIKLRVPRFDLRTRLAIDPLLDSLGMSSLMRPGSFFPGLKVSPCSLSTLDQQLTFSFHAKGVQATAQTAAIVSGMGSAPGARELTFNRPFLFTLEDASGTILIAGQHIDPMPIPQRP